MKRRPTPAARPAFTLVELMVAMALIIFIMYILAEAFAAGTAAYRNLKAVGDLNLKLRTVSNLLRNYLAADHFEQGRRLSDSNFWTQLPGPPTQGFFRIVQSGQATPEGSDLDNIASTRTSLQALHFTSHFTSRKYPANDPGDFFRTSVGVASNSPLLTLGYPDSRYQDSTSGAYCSQWAEVAVFLRDSGLTTESPASVAAGLTPQKLFTLYLRQRLLLPDGPYTNAAVNPAVTYPAATPNPYLEVSATQDPNNPKQFYFNASQDVTMPVRRFGVAGAPLTAASDLANVIPAKAPAVGSNSPQTAYPTFSEEDANQGGNDILIPDVLSFSVKVLLAKSAYGNQSPTFVDLNDTVVQQYVTSPANPSVPQGTTVFDTWSSQTDPSVAAFDYKLWSVGGTSASIPMYKASGNGSAPAGDLISLQAIQIIIRVWDTRTQQARQSSIVVPL